jgi:biopolymer transport protein ExbD
MRLEMTPLIDVVFLLLTFFLFAMMVMVRVDILGVRLPTISAGSPAEERSIVAVTLSAEGAASIDGEAMGLDALVARVLERKGENPETLVFVAADRACDAGALLGVLDRFAQAGIADVSLVGAPGAGGEAP